jgi:hypothetical protein
MVFYLAGLWCYVRLQGYKILPEQPMHKDASAADFVEEDVLGAVIQEMDVVPGRKSLRDAMPTMPSPFTLS